MLGVLVFSGSLDRFTAGNPKPATALAWFPFMVALLLAVGWLVTQRHGGAPQLWFFTARSSGFVSSSARGSVRPWPKISPNSEVRYQKSGQGVGEDRCPLGRENLCVS